MPLVATRNGERLEAHRIDADAWAALKREYRTDGLTLACGNPGFPKTLKTTQFFSHFTACEHHTGPESAEHLAAKAAIADAARASGWEATIEYPAPDRSWIADVLAERDGRRVALEVQWSPQSAEEFRRRQERYADSGVECVWFVHDRNRDAAAGLPRFVLRGEPDAFTAALRLTVGGSLESRPLAEVVRQHLDGTIAQRAEVRATALILTTTMMRCWSKTCNSWMTFWYVSGAELETRCGQTATLECNGQYIPHMTDRVEASVQGHVRTGFEGKDLPEPVKYERRWTKTHDGEYMAAICPACNSLQGDAFIAFTDRRYSDFRLPGRVGLRVDEQVRQAEHLCTDIGRGVCSQTVGEAYPLFPHLLSPDWWLTPGTAEFDVPEMPARRPRKTYTPPPAAQRRMPRFQ